MSNLYHIGLVIGLIVVYFLVTLGFGFLLSLLDDDNDGVGALVAGYVIGVLAFLFVSTELLDAKGYWDLPQTQIIEEIETEVME